MRGEVAILDRWFAGAVESYPVVTARFLTSEKDQFRNPVGHTLRENLAVLLLELLGGMEPARTKPALEAIIRLRAVQELTAAQATGFVFLVRPLLRQMLAEPDAALIDRKIDQLAQLACEEYARCREHLSAIRISENSRAMAVPAAMRRARS